jgi:hypothetical protein
MNPLGAELSRHRGRCPNAHRLGIAFEIVGVISGICLFARHPEPVYQIGFWALLVCLVWTIATVMRIRATEIVVREHGLEWSRGRAHGAMRFDEIASVLVRRWPGGEPNRLRFRLHDGKTVWLTAHVLDIARLLERFQGMKRPPALPVAILQR